MNDDNDTDRPAPAGPGENPGWVPTPDRPWRPVADEDDGAPYHRDYGAPWCADRASHPQFQEDGYPSLNHHRTECRSYDGFSFGAVSEDGRPGFFSAYLVRPFRFGQLGHAGVETRLAIEFDPAEDDAGQPFRCTVPASIIRNLAAHLAETAGVADGWRPPHHVPVFMTD